VSWRRSFGAALAAAACLAVLSACSGDGEDGGGDGTTTAPEARPGATTAPAGPPPGATEAGLRDLEVGNCFDLVDDPVAADRAVWLLDCAEPHSHEVYDVVEYEGEGAGGGMPYPGVAVVQNWSEDQCYQRFEGFVGTRWTLSELEIEVWWPSAESWDLMDRSVICTVFSPTGDPLTGTQRGAGS
jgi:hypothetical protein